MFHPRTDQVRFGRSLPINLFTREQGVLDYFCGRRIICLDEPRYACRAYVPSRGIFTLIDSAFVTLVASSANTGGGGTNGYKSLVNHTSQRGTNGLKSPEENEASSSVSDAPREVLLPPSQCDADGTPARQLESFHEGRASVFLLVEEQSELLNVQGRFITDLALELGQLLPSVQWPAMPPIPAGVVGGNSQSAADASLVHVSAERTLNRKVLDRKRACKQYSHLSTLTPISETYGFGLYCGHTPGCPYVALEAKTSSKAKDVLTVRLTPSEAQCFPCPHCGVDMKVHSGSSSGALQSVISRELELERESDDSASDTPAPTPAPKSSAPAPVPLSAKTPVPLSAPTSVPKAPARSPALNAGKRKFARFKSPCITPHP